MIRVRPNIFIGHANGKSIKLIYRGSDKSDLYINGEFKGICSFSYTKSKVEELEKIDKRKGKMN